MRVLFNMEGSVQRCSVFEDVYFGNVRTKQGDVSGLLFTYNCEEEPHYFIPMSETDARSFLYRLLRDGCVDLTSQPTAYEDFDEIEPDEED